MIWVIQNLFINTSSFQNVEIETKSFMYLHSMQTTKHISFIAFYQWLHSNANSKPYFIYCLSVRENNNKPKSKTIFYWTMSKFARPSEHPSLLGLLVDSISNLSDNDFDTTEGAFESFFNENTTSRLLILNSIIDLFYWLIKWQPLNTINQKSLLMSTWTI